MGRKYFLLGILLVVTAACNLPDVNTKNESAPTISSQSHICQSEDFRFTIPQGWLTKEEVWQRPMDDGQEFYGLGVQEIITIQFPPEQGKGRNFFSVSSSPPAKGESLEDRVARTYENTVPAVEKMARQDFVLGELSGLEVIYERPWGEPWWEFHDIWLEHGGMVYVLSSHTYKGSYENISVIFDEIVASFEFIE